MFDISPPTHRPVTAVARRRVGAVVNRLVGMALPLKKRSPQYSIRALTFISYEIKVGGGTTFFLFEKKNLNKISETGYHAYRYVYAYFKNTVCQ